MAGDKSDNKGAQATTSKPPTGGDSTKHKTEPAKGDASADKEKSKSTNEKAEVKPPSSGAPKPEAKGDSKSQPAAAKPKDAQPSDNAKAKEQVAEDDAPPAKPPLYPIDEPTPEREPLLDLQEIDVDQDPNRAARAPGRAPRGDARSFRRATEFCFVYRKGQYLITRRGAIGKMGEWTIVEYPDKGSAGHAYAEECSILGSEGFSDFRGD